jgi:hypothetical protein
MKGNMEVEAAVVVEGENASLAVIDAVIHDPFRNLNHQSPQRHRATMNDRESPGQDKLHFILKHGAVVEVKCMCSRASIPLRDRVQIIGCTCSLAGLSSVRGQPKKRPPPIFTRINKYSHIRRRRGKSRFAFQTKIEGGLRFGPEKASLAACSRFFSSHS